MAHRICIVLLAAFCSAVSAKSLREDGARLEDYPSLVQVENYVSSDVWTQSCAATIITSRHMLSAANCFSGELFSPTYRRIRAGSVYRGTGGIVSVVAVVVNHPTWDSETGVGDISMVTLETPLTLSNVVQQGWIITQNIYIPGNLPAVQAGWAKYDEEGDRIPTLQEVDVVTMNMETCAGIYEEAEITIPENILCSGILIEDGAGADEGDLGGPLYYQDIVVGINSFKGTYDNETLPYVHTAVSFYTDWVIEVVG